MFSKLFTILLLVLSFTFTQTLPVLVGGCKGTQFGCCNETQLVCLDSNCSNCNTTKVNVELIGGCQGTQFGCCNQTQLVCQDFKCSNCYNHSIN